MIKIIAVNPNGIGKISEFLGDGPATHAFEPLGGTQDGLPAGCFVRFLTADRASCRNGLPLAKAADLWDS